MITNNVEYIISKAGTAFHDDGHHEYFIINLFVELADGSIELSKNMVVSRDFVYSLAALTNINFFTVETTQHNTLGIGQPVFIDEGFLTVHPGFGTQCDNLGKLPTFDMEVRLLNNPE